MLLLIEELLDSQSISDCRTVFSFLESRREVIIAVSLSSYGMCPYTHGSQIHSKNKDLVILRLCNELLRRLSRAEDPVFCGRVYVFMFQSFPLGDKSSVNLRGAFHVENITTFEDFLKDSSTNEDAMQTDDDGVMPKPTEESTSDDKTVKAEEESKSQERKPTTLDIDALYPVFWSLQHSFSDPTKLFDEGNFKQFKSSLEATLAKFQEVPKVIQAGSLERKKGQRVRADDDYDAFANTYNPKYLTSRDLFKLEVCKLCHTYLELMTDVF